MKKKQERKLRKEEKKWKKEKKKTINPKLLFSFPIFKVWSLFEGRMEQHKKKKRKRNIRQDHATQKTR